MSPATARQPTQKKKKRLIEEVVERVRRNAGPDRELAAAIARHGFAEAALEDLERAGVPGLAAAAVRLLALAKRRTPGKLALEISNPEGDWDPDRTVIQIVNDDMPFLVDSVTNELRRRDLTIHLALHPQVPVRRDDDGRLLEVLKRAPEEPEPGVATESLMHVEVDRQASPAVLVELETALRRVLAHVRTAVEDWRPMRAATARLLDELDDPPPLPAAEVKETREFLRWVYEDHFTFLGYLEFRLEEEDGAKYLRPIPETGLGLLRKLPLGERAVLERPLTPEALRFLEGDRLVAISKTSSKATVHRNVHMDLISIKRFDEEGRPIGEARLLGLFTSMAYSIPVGRIPLVRRKVKRVIARTGYPPISHNAKTLRHIVENYPRDELFQISDDDLYRFARRILELQHRPRLALLLRRDEEERFVSCMVYVPRERHSTRLRVRMQEVLERAFNGEVTAFYTRISERPLAQVLLIVKTQPGSLPPYDVAEIEARLAEVARSWSEDDLKEILTAERGLEHGLATWRRYAEAFPAAYQESFGAADAAADIPVIEEVLETQTLGMRLYRRAGAVRNRFHFRTFELAIPAPLSDILPMLENMGLEVHRENPFEVRPETSPNPVWVRDFDLVADAEVDPERDRDRFTEAFARVWHGEVEDDPFNKLVLRAGLSWRQVVMLRAYYKYLRQTGSAFSQRAVAEALSRHPKITRLLIELFHAALDPAAKKKSEAAREERVRILHRRIQQALEAVSSRDEDRILWRFSNLVLSTLRTNYFQRGPGGAPKDYLSFKFDGMRLRGLPEPRPRYEIFVYSPRVEAVHLRGGPVARGGIRWSDRRADFRTEVLGLLKSQMVKNAVIVPVGAKGGFVVKRPPADRDALLAEGIACYRTMIRGMLDLTDNLLGEEVVPPPEVVRRDGDDPYLVVAADKGTATFSDVANEIAAEYGYWLGDAFASGGSAGYDHKRMGITARGAWESVRRHFRELGRDVDSEAVTVVGIGDMSGDVFGNAMLLSPHLKLLAAFNHLHVFIDPDPDPAVSFAERQRLFALPRSSWKDYDPAALSSGGGVFDRHAKKLDPSPEARQLLGLGVGEVTPDELVQAVLRLKVDLLWFGGIGTFVKASTESNVEVEDWANDDVRIDARELGAQVVGEGANLGLTQAARIEFALGGGRINTDFIDNSGGVDCSDHEVNIKIALEEAIAAGELERGERDALLAAMTEEVAALVLRDNYLQTQSITLTETKRAGLLEEHGQLIRTFERAGLLDRRREGLPDETTLAERREQKQGLTRPEIAVLLAYSKIFVYNELLDSALPDEKLLVEDLVRYFPGPMRKRFRRAIERHRLRREIIATHVTNSLLNRVGPTFVTRLAAETGASVSDIARAYTAARDVFDLRSVWDEIEALDHRRPADLQNRLWAESVGLLERATRWFLRYGGRPLDISTCVKEYEPDIVTVAAQLEDLLPAKARARVRRRYRRFIEQGVPEELARAVAGMDLMHLACDAARGARVAGVAVEQLAKVYFAVGERFGFDRLRSAASRLGADSPWQQAAVNASVEDLQGHQAAIAQQVAARDGKVRAAIEEWVGERAAVVRRIDDLLQGVDVLSIDLAMLIVVERELRRLAEKEPGTS